MSLFEVFTADLGNYDIEIGSEAEWSATYGNPAAGCAKLVGRGAGASGGPIASAISNTTDTYTLVANAPTLYCNARFVATGGSMDWCMYPLVWTVGFSVEADLVYNLAGTGFGADTGWIQLAFPLTGRNIGAIINSIQFYVPQPGSFPATCGSGLIITAYFDSITVGTPPALGPEFPAGSGTIVALTRSGVGIPGSILL